MFDYIIYTDGGCASNPGGRGGYGAVIIDCGSGEETELSEGFIASTNNRMEVMAAIKALEAVAQMRDGKSRIQLYSDSQYFINTAKGIWHGDKNPDLWRRYRKASCNAEIELKWIRGHNGTLYNERCDELATLAMQGDSLAVDEGFYAGISNNSDHDKKKSITHYGNAMERKIITDFSESTVTADEMVKRGVNAGCIKAISDIAKKEKPGFKDFFNLKTFGRDKISGMSVHELVEISGEKAWQQIQKHFPESNANALSALRWHVRGLPISYAIRKEMVNQEISENAIKSKNRR